MGTIIVCVSQIMVLVAQILGIFNLLKRSNAGKDTDACKTFVSSNIYKWFRMIEVWGL